MEITVVTVPRYAWSQQYEAAVLGVSRAVVNFIVNDDVFNELFAINPPWVIFQDEIDQELFEVMDVDNWLSHGAASHFDPGVIWDDVMYQVMLVLCAPDRSLDMSYRSEGDD